MSKVSETARTSAPHELDEPGRKLEGSRLETEVPARAVRQHETEIYVYQAALGIEQNVSIMS